MAKTLARAAPSNVFMHFDRRLAAACLWDYGEDVLVDRVLGVDDDALWVMQRVAVVYDDQSYPLPLSGQRITRGHTIAFAVVTYFEGLRPLARSRRRPAKSRPGFS
jgi:hypothetical protein